MTGKRENLGRSCHLNAAYHGKELRSIYPDLAFTRPRIHSVFKSVHSVEQIQKYPDTCGQGLKLNCRTKFLFNNRQPSKAQL